MRVYGGYSILQQLAMLVGKIGSIVSVALALTSPSFSNKRFQKLTCLNNINLQATYARLYLKLELVGSR